MKKIIFLLVRRHSGEIDWILPIISNLNKNYEIFTIFQDEGAFESLKKNYSLFKFWKKTTEKFFILKKNENLIFKFLNKLFKRFKIYKLLNKNIKIKILYKVYSLDKILENKNISEISAIFTTNLNYSEMPSCMKFLNKNIKIFLYPEGAWIFFDRRLNTHYKFNRTLNINYDYFLISDKNSQKHFFYRNKKDVKKSIICGIPRLDKKWKKKFITNKNKEKKKTILVITRHPDDIFFLKTSYKRIIDSIANYSIKKKYKLIFKTHPHLKDLDFLLKILKEYKNLDYKIKFDHILQLAKFSDICISMLTSGCLDTLSLKKTTIEYFNSKFEINRNKHILTYTTRFIKNKNNDWVTIFNYFDLVKTVENDGDFINLMKQIETSKKYNNHQIKKFEKMNLVPDLDVITNKINNILNQKK